MPIVLADDDLRVAFHPLGTLEDKWRSLTTRTDGANEDANPHPRPALARLIGDTSIEDFWEERPHLATGLGDFDDVFSIHEVDKLVTAGGLRHPSFRLLYAGETLPTARYTRAPQRPPGAVRYRPSPGVMRATEPMGPPPVDGLMDAARVNQLVADGATLVLQGLRLYWREVDQFCVELGQQIGHPIHANAYLTPPGASGAGPHWDMHSVFIRQVAGAKIWRLHEPVEKWPRRMSTRSAAEDSPLVAEYVLREGDCLYIPRGFIHHGRAVDTSPSVHATFGLHDPTTWADWLGDIVRGLSDDDRLREILPPKFTSDPGGVEKLLATRLDLVINELASLDVEATTARIIRDQGHTEPDRAPGRLRSLMTPVGPNTLFRADPHLVTMAADPDDEGSIIVETPYGSLSCPAAVTTALGAFLDGHIHALSEWFSGFDEDSATLLARRLVSCGALSVI